MDNIKQAAFYSILALSIFTIVLSHSILSRNGCCEQVLAGKTQWITDGPPTDETAGFGGLVWAKTRNGIQLRFSYTIDEGVHWTPLLAPAGTQDSRQADSLRRLFGEN